MKMRAAVLRAQGRPRPYSVSRPMTIETVDLDPPGPGEVLYEIIGASLCHSDLSTIEGLRPRRLPTIPGHEAAGIVRDVGPEVIGLKPGDQVVSVLVTSCGDCRYCNGGRPNLCQSSFAARAEGALISGARRLSLNGEPLHHYSGLYMGSCVPKRDIPRLIALYQRGKLPVDRLRSGSIRLEQINHGFDRLADGAVLSQVLQPHA